MTGEAEGRRLHPATLVQRLTLALPGLLLLVVPYWRGAEAGTAFLVLVAAFVVFYLLFVLPITVARYLRFRYWITPNEIVTQSGVFTTQRRNIPLERVQNIEIQQPPSARLFGTARVSIATAGSGQAEGVLEFVALDEARNIRSVVRAYQRGHGPTDVAGPAIPAPPSAMSAGDEEPSEPLISLSSGRVLLSGMYRFSLLYILVIFSGIQFFQINPEEIIDWVTAGGLEPATRLIEASPWLAGLAAVVLAALFSWVAGIAVNVNRYLSFRLAREGDKLHRRHGLLTRLEGTVPLKKVQALVLTANAAMRARGWSSLSLQTMGANPDQQGNQLAVPFAKVEEVLAVSPAIMPFALPDRFLSVSTKTIRRTTIRYTMVLLVLAGVGWLVWSDAVWVLALWPFVPLLAYLQYRNHGYSLDGRHLVVRRGVIVHRVWVLPIEKLQVLYASATFFQRRLRLATLHPDTAGAPTYPVAEIVDLPEDAAAELLQRLHAAMQAGAGAPVEALPF